MTREQTGKQAIGTKIASSDLTGDYELITDSQEVRAIKCDLSGSEAAYHEQYDDAQSFMVGMGDGCYNEIWASNYQFPCTFTEYTRVK
jgi:hypothetical protein